MPTFSVIVPAYNCERYIGDCLWSVMSQDFADWELLVVDDGSTDDTPERIKAAVDGDTRVKYVPKENGGVSNARNAGLTLAKGEYAVFLDADDELAPGALALFAAAARSGSSVIIATSQVVDGEGRCISTVALPEEWRGVEPAEARVAAMGVPEKAPLLHYVWGRVYNLAALAGAGVAFDENVSLGEDFIFNCLVFGMGGNVQIIDGVAYRYSRRGGCSLSNGFRTGELERRRCMEEAFWGLLERCGQGDSKRAMYERCVGAIALYSVEAVGLAQPDVSLEEKIRYLRGFRSSEYRGYINSYVKSHLCGFWDWILSKAFLIGADRAFVFLSTLKHRER